ncbi:MAG: transporter [Gemmatimonadales bacterium]
MKRFVLACGAIATGFVSPLAAQKVTLRDRITDLFAFGSCGHPLCLDGSVSAANGHGDHFLPDLALENAAVISFLTGSIAANISNAPATASPSGATYRFVGGLPVKTSESVGPIFAERAQTLGRGRFLIGARLSTENLSTLREVPLDGLNLNFTHQDVAPAGLGDPLLENDVLEVDLAMELGLDVTSFFVTYGLTNRVDLSLVVPVVHTSMQARANAQIHTFGPTAVHFFSGTPEDPGLLATAATFGSSTGIGDLAFRAKANLYAGDHFALGLLGDLRFPTGDEDNFTGAGSTSFRALMAGSARFGTFSPHLNAGYLFRGGESRNDVVLVTTGFDQPLSPWATLAVEMVSEWQPGANKILLPGTVTFDIPFHRTAEPTNIPDTRDHRMLTSIGAKFRTSDNGPVLIGSMLVPVIRGGLQPAVMWTMGLDFGF